MSADDVRNVLVPLSIVLLLWSQRLEFRDRDRRERQLRERPQPLRPTSRSRLLLGLSCIGLAVAAVLLVV